MSIPDVDSRRLRGLALAPPAAGGGGRPDPAFTARVLGNLSARRPRGPAAGWWLLAAIVLAVATGAWLLEATAPGVAAPDDLPLLEWALGALVLAVLLRLLRIRP